MPAANELLQLSDQFAGLDMAQLIGGPLKATCDAQVGLAKATASFITEIGFVARKDDKGNITGYDTRQVEFTFKRPINKDDGTITQSAVDISAPILCIVPIPALRVELVTVDFEMEVKSSFSSKSTTDYQASIDASFGWGPFSVKITGSIAAHNEQTRASDNSAKYQVHVEARQAQPPEGLMRILDLLNSSVAPKAIKAAS